MSKFDRWDEFAFEGETVGEITIKIADAETTRPFRVVWQHTPEWEHYNEQHQELVPDGGAPESYSFKTELHIEPGDSVFDINASDLEIEPHWQEIELPELGFPGEAAQLALEDDIKRQCEIMDQQRRKKYLRT